MRIRLLGTLLACMLAAFLATAATGSSKRPVVIDFEKDCPEWTCWETPGSPVEVDTTIEFVDIEGGLFHYTSVETLSSSKGSVTVSLVGVLYLDAEPDQTVLTGYVIRGYLGRKEPRRSVRPREGPPRVRGPVDLRRPGDDHAQSVTGMPLYLAELYQSSAESGDLAEAAARARAAASAMAKAGTRIRYVRSVFVPSDETWFLLYDADLASDVVEAASRAGIHLERVVEALETEPSPSQRRFPGCSGQTLWVSAFRGDPRPPSVDCGTRQGGLGMKRLQVKVFSRRSPSLHSPRRMRREQRRADRGASRPGSEAEESRRRDRGRCSSDHRDDQRRCSLGRPQPGRHGRADRPTVRKDGRRADFRRERRAQRRGR